MHHVTAVSIHDVTTTAGAITWRTLRAAANQDDEALRAAYAALLDEARTMANAAGLMGSRRYDDNQADEAHDTRLVSVVALDPDQALEYDASDADALSRGREIDAMKAGLP